MSTISGKSLRALLLAVLLPVASGKPDEINQMQKMVAETMVAETMVVVTMVGGVYVYPPQQSAVPR